MPDEEPIHQCKDCGLLAIRRDTGGTNPQTLDEVDFRTRQTGEVLKPEHRESPSSHERVPHCAVLRHILDEEAKEEKRSGRSKDDAAAFLSVIQKPDRRCGRFLRWTQMLSPKEHLLMNMLDNILTKRDVWQGSESRHNRRANLLNTLLVVVGTICASLFGAIIGGNLARQGQPAAMPPAAPAPQSIAPANALTAPSPADRKATQTNDPHPMKATA